VCCLCVRGERGEGGERRVAVCAVCVCVRRGVCVRRRRFGRGRELGGAWGRMGEGERCSECGVVCVLKERGGAGGRCREREAVRRGTVREREEGSGAPNLRCSERAFFLWRHECPRRRQKSKISDFADRRRSRIRRTARPRHARTPAGRNDRPRGRLHALLRRPPLLRRVYRHRWRSVSSWRV